MTFPTQQPLKRRLKLSFIAAASSQVVTIFNQLLLIPILLRAWGLEMYGVWIAVSSLFAYVASLSEFGFSNVAASELGMKRATGREGELQAIFQSIFLVLFLTACAAVGVGILAATFVPMGDMLGLGTNWNAPVAILFLIFSLQQPANLIGILSCSILRAEGKMACGQFRFYVLGRIAEFACLATAAFFGAGLALAALLVLIVKVVLAGIMIWTVRKEADWVRWSVRSAQLSIIRSLIAPAGAHLASSFGTLFGAAGVNIIVSILLGAQALASLAVIRTLGNLSFHAFNVLIQAMWADMSHLVGSGNIVMAQKIVTTVGKVSFWLSLLACAMLALFGSPFIQLWTSGLVQLHWPLFAGQLVSVALACIWRVPSVTLLATNRNARVGIFTLLGAVLSVILTAALVPRFGLTGVGLALCIAEAFVLASLLKPELAALGLRVPPYLLELAKPPRPSLIRKLAKG